MSQKFMIVHKMMENEFLETQPFITIVKEPNDDIIQALEDAKQGNLNSYSSTDELFNKFIRTGCHSKALYLKIKVGTQSVMTGEGIPPCGRNDWSVFY